MHEVRRAAGEIRVDGDLGDPGWAGADVIVADVETYPGDNLPSPASAACRLAYDEHTLYVAIHAFDPQPTQIRAHYSDRDGAFEDDFVGVVLDTFDDERRAYEFFVNPLGVQMDLVKDDVSRDEDSSWDAIWASAGRIGADGYAVEMAIPFAQLRFPPGGGRQRWGIDVVRIWPRDQRYSIHSQPLNRDRNCYLCQLSRLAGLEGARPGRSLELDPTVTAVRDESRDPFPGGELESAGTDVEAGITARWGVTPNVTLAGTINPDFSQVEADAAQLDVNTQFALFYEEKRPFFLEGADFFTTPVTAVYTRTVADPAWGVKASGKVGRQAFGVFVARDETTNILLPGKDGSDLTALDGESVAAVARLRHDLGSNSTVGALVTARRGDGYENTLAGIDAQLQASAADRVVAQALYSATAYPEELAAAQGQPAGTLDGLAATLAYRHNTRDWHWDAEIERFDAEFRADLGFVPQVDYRQGSAGVERTWWGGPDDWHSRIELGGDWEYSEGGDGRLLEREVETWLFVGGPLQSAMIAAIGHRDRAYNGVLFDQEFVHLSGAVRPSGAVSLELSGSWGDHIDYAHTRPGRRLRVEPEATLRIGRHLRLSGACLYERFTVDAGQLYEAKLPQLRAVWQFSLRTFLRVVSQYTEVTRDPALYDDPVSATERDLFNQVLLSYTLNPQTVVFLGYSDRAAGFEEGADSVDLTTAARTVFVKLGYAWLP